MLEDLPASLPIIALGAVFFLCGLFLRLRSHWRIRVANRWPTVTGTIVHASIVLERSRKSRFYRGIVAYTYRVGGIELTGGRICLVEDGKRGRSSDAAQDLARYPVGAVVQVHYDPATPGLACLVIDGPLRGALYLIAFGLAVAALGPFVANWY